MQGKKSLDHATGAYSALPHLTSKMFMFNIWDYLLYMPIENKFQFYLNFSTMQIH